MTSTRNKLQRLANGDPGIKASEIPSLLQKAVFEMDDLQTARTVLGRLVALIPLKDIPTATENGATLVEYFKRRLTDHDD